VIVGDCKRAMGWIRSEGQEYGMNPDFVAVTGGSAGGHLTALLGLTGNLPELQAASPDADTTVQAVVPFYGVYDLLSRHDPANAGLFENFAMHKVLYESPEENPELWDLVSPVTHIGPENPPFMVIQGGIDSLTTVTGARHFHRKLKEVAGNTAVYLELPGAEHAFDSLHSPRTDPVIRGVHRFLEWARARHREGAAES
jgi:acetyl esterase/lipase